MPWVLILNAIISLIEVGEPGVEKIINDLKQSGELTDEQASGFLTRMQTARQGRAWKTDDQVPQSEGGTAPDTLNGG